MYNQHLVYVAICERTMYRSFRRIIAHHVYMQILVQVIPLEENFTNVFERKGLLHNDKAEYVHWRKKLTIVTLRIKISEMIKSFRLKYK